MIKTIGERAFAIILGAGVVAACSGKAITSNVASSAPIGATGGSDLVASGGTSIGGTTADGFGGASAETGGAGGGSTAGSAGGTGGSTAGSTGGSGAGGGSGGSGGSGTVTTAGSGGSAGAVNNAPINVLVFNYTAGFAQQSRETAIPLLQAAAAASNINLDLKYAILTGKDGNYIPEGTSDLEAAIPVDLSAFTPGGLDKYDVIYFLNTSGHVFEGTDELIHQQALQDYMEQHHGGFVGTLSATHTYDEGWPWYRDMIGSNFKTFSNISSGSARWKDSAGHVILTTAMVPNPWARPLDEFYNFQHDVSSLPGFTVLLLASETGGTDRQSAWIHELPGGGRVFYSGFGYLAATFQDPTFMTFLMTGIKWAAHRL